MEMIYKISQIIAGQILNQAVSLQFKKPVMKGDSSILSFVAGFSCV